MMRAKEVLRLYENGERNFCNIDLIRADFRGTDLSGSNFQGANIRSANFTNTDLKETNFTGSRAGIAKWNRAFQLILQTSLICFFIYLLRLLAYLPDLLHDIFMMTRPDEIGLWNSPILVGSQLLFQFISAFVFLRVGFTLKGFNILFPVGLIICALSFQSNLRSGLFIDIYVGLFLGVTYSFLILLSISSFAVANRLMAVIFSLGIIIISVEATPTLILMGMPDWYSLIVSVTSLGIFLVTLLGSYLVARKALRGDEKFSLVHTLGVRLGALGGTQFRGADLTDANFAQANLKRADFSNSRKRPTKFTRICWHDAKQLNRACLGSSILRDAKVRTLLTTPEKGYKQDFTGANLSGAFLKGADLESAIFRDADLSEASLESAVLKDANLTRAQAVGTNFTRASLTGATIESWNIDSTTILKAIDCEFIFLLENMDSSGSRERLPHDSDQFFQPGDFEKFFQEFLDEVKLLIRKGIDPIAFRTAFQKVMEEHSYIDQESIRSLTKKDDDVMLTLQVPVGTDKSEVVRSWEAGYQKGLNEMINQRRIGVGQNAYTSPLNLTISARANNRSKTVKGNDQSQNFDVKGDFNVDANQSTISFRDVTGEVVNKIKSENSHSTSGTNLKELLMELQSTLDKSLVLTDEAKAFALEQVKVLAESEKSPKEGAFKKRAYRALTTLKGTIVGVDETTKLVKSLNVLLPAIAKLLGL